MVGVAAEIEFLRMIEAGANNPVHAGVFKKITAERNLRSKITKFQAAISALPPAVRDSAGEDLAALNQRGALPRSCIKRLRHATPADSI